MTDSYDVLNEHGFFMAKDTFRASSREVAVKRFQRAWNPYKGANPLVVDGILGPKTGRAMQTLPLLSPHFTVWEMWDAREQSCGIRRELLVALEQLRARYGLPISVRSGYRTFSTNTLLKGAASSVHLQGLAADIRVNIRAVKMIGYQLFSGIGVEGDSTGIVSHVDLRHVLGDDSPTPRATVRVPARWIYRRG